MSSVFVGILLGLGIAGWVFSKAMRRTGDNTKSSLVLAGIIGFIAFVVGTSIMAMVNSFLE